MKIVILILASICVGAFIALCFIALLSQLSMQPIPEVAVHVSIACLVLVIAFAFWHAWYTQD